MNRLTINIKKRYDDYMLYNGDTAYVNGKLPRSEYVSPYKEDIYMPRNDNYVNASKRECYNKLGRLEDLEEKLGCPLEVYVKLRYNTPIFDESGCWGILNYIDYNEKLKVYYMEVVFFSKKEGCKNCVRSFLLADYKKTWWLKEDKSE